MKSLLSTQKASTRGNQPAHKSMKKVSVVRERQCSRLWAILEYPDSNRIFIPSLGSKPADQRNQLQHHGTVPKAKNHPTFQHHGQQHLLWLTGGCWRASVPARAARDPVHQLRATPGERAHPEAEVSPIWIFAAFLSVSFKIWISFDREFISAETRIRLRAQLR